jgi:hypothetical protein
VFVDTVCELGLLRPDLGLHRVGRSAEERLDAQMLFDPFEEDLDLPAMAIQRADGGRRQREVIRQQHNRIVRLRIAYAQTPQRCRIPK